MNPSSDDRVIAYWLLTVCALIFAMVMLGGVTRLTGSGLSMVDWKPIMGTLPPMSEQAWQETFHKYKQFPEYQKVNHAMDLHEFKSIFWFEYAHRVLGRSIGVAFLLPFLWFAIRRRLKRELWPKLAGMFLLGGLQGLLGWYMVKSGLIDRPRVSQYRLTAHLSLAVAIYGYMLWVALGVLRPGDSAWASDAAVRLRPWAIGLTALICLMIVSGGFVAGTHAGFVYNTFPDMNGSFLPPGLYGLSPWWHNLFEDLTTVQFNHRMIAYVIVIVVSVFWWMAHRSRLHPDLQWPVHFLLAAMVLQVSLGISTILTTVAVPVAAAHQGGALILLTAAIFSTHRLVIASRLHGSVT